MGDRQIEWRIIQILSQLQQFVEEVILALKKQVQNDSKFDWICNTVHKDGELRRLIRAGKDTRGLSKKEHRDAKVRPSRRANYKRRNQISQPRNG